nr:CoA-acylating methylmalonate-semialdehyde dehydrogenase [Maliibacterium massiliense]
MKKVMNCIGGKWCDPTGNRYADVINPSNNQVIGQVARSTKEDVDAATAAAKEAFKSWSKMPTTRRAKFMFRLVDLITEHFEDISRLVSLEEGKNLTDARAEVKRAQENTEVATGIPSLIAGDMMQNIAGNIDGYTIKQPIGVFGIICPFNFPAMIPFWFFPYAVGTGNTVVIKVSRQVPLTMQYIMELIQEAGFPDGVVNIVNGDREVVTAMLESEDIAGISFVGSTPIAKLIAERCGATGKRFQALGGAKNYFLVMPDAKMDKVISSLMTSCFGCAGERCMAASVVVGVGDVYDELIEKFRDAAAKLVVGDALDPAVDVGPVIGQGDKDRILGYIDGAIAQGAKVILDGRNPQIKGDPNGFYVGPTILENCTRDMAIWKDEVFGPVVICFKCDSFEEAMEHMNSHHFGNGASIFTQNGYYARQFEVDAQAGMLGINVGVPAPMALLPFGGVKQSFFGDIKGQSKHVIDFFTTSKVVTTRFFPED